MWDFSECVIVIVTKSPHWSPCCWLRLPRLRRQGGKLGGCSSRSRWWKENNTECTIVCLSTHPLVIEVCERNVLRTQASPHQRRQNWLIWRPSPPEIGGFYCQRRWVGLCSAPDSLFTTLELSVFKPRSVRPAQDFDCTVTVCGSHVKRVIKLVVHPPATVGLGLCSQLRILSLTTLPSLRWSFRVETVVGLAFQRIGLHRYCLWPPREACFDLSRWFERVETVQVRPASVLSCTATDCSVHV